MSDPSSPFVHDTSCEPGRAAAGVRLGPLEARYEELFSQVIEDGIIAHLERALGGRRAQGAW